MPPPPPPPPPPATPRADDGAQSTQRNMSNTANTTFAAMQTLQSIKRQVLSLYAMYKDLCARYPTLRYGDRILLSLMILPIVSLLAMGAGCLGLLSIFAISVISIVQMFIIFVGLCILLPFLSVAAVATLFCVVILSAMRSMLACIGNALAWMKQRLWRQYRSSAVADGLQELWDRVSLMSNSTTATEGESIQSGNGGGV